MSPGAERAPGWWNCVALRPDGSTAWFAAVPTGLHADGERVELPEVEAAALIGGSADVVARFDGADVVALEQRADFASGTPVWFAELTEPDASPAATNLVVFTGHDVPAGTLLDRSQLTEVPVRTPDQLGAMRWWPATGEIDQIYVAPTRRREGIATTLLVTVGTLQRARGGPRVWSDGQRTALGDRLAHSGPWPGFFAELEHLAPPMTPFDQR